MRETKGVEEARAWRQKVYEETKDMSPAQRRAREEEFLKTLREAGIDFPEALLGAHISSSL